MKCTLEQLKDILAEEAGISRSEITEDTELSSLGIDSLGAVQLLYRIEGELGIRMERRTYQTVGDLVQ